VQPARILDSVRSVGECMGELSHRPARVASMAVETSTQSTRVSRASSSSTPAKILDLALGFMASRHLFAASEMQDVAAAAGEAAPLERGARPGPACQSHIHSSTALWRSTTSQYSCLTRGFRKGQTCGKHLNVSLEGPAGRVECSAS
jgi:hypothetical protein